MAATSSRNAEVEVFKFRSMDSDEAFKRVIDIIENRAFWCSRFSELNDPMEGVYRSLGTRGVNDIYNEKKSYMICSFAREEAFSNPAMWGYYSGGFKGVAIKIRVPAQDLTNIDYSKCILDFADGEPDVKRILTTKLDSWDHEYESRFLKQTSQNSQSIGKLVSVYYSEPYKNTVNHNAVYRDTNGLNTHVDRVELLKAACKTSNLDCIPVRIITNRVEPIKQS